MDLFGKEPDLFYKGKSKINTIIGTFFSFIYISLYLSYLFYKLLRIFERKDVKFYDTYAFDEEIPSINITNEEFYGAFTLGGSIDETLYHIKAQYVSGVKKGEIWNYTYKDLEIERCKIEKFGSKYREFFKDKSLDKSYCLKNVDLKLEGYSYLTNFSYINLKIFPCVNQTKDGIPCKDYNQILHFFEENIIEFKMQDNLLTPEKYNSPVKPLEKDITCPIFLKIYQKIYSYIQIVRVETDEDITGINLIPKNKVEIFTKYTDSFLIATPGSDDILKTGGPVCDITLQLAANVLTQRRNYTTLLDVFGEVGGLMEFIYSFFNIILSFIVNEVYEKSLVNSLFSFNIDRNLILFKNKYIQNNKDNINDFQKIESDKKVNINSKEKNDKINVEKNIYKSTNNNQLSSHINMYMVSNDMTSISTQTSIKNEKKIEKYGIIEDINKICLCFLNKKRSLEKIFFEEGKKLITEKLDISNLFINSFRVEKNKENLPIKKYVPISVKYSEYISGLLENI